MKSLALILACAAIAYAGTTIRDQSIPTTWAVAKTTTKAALLLETPTQVGELRMNTTDMDLYTSTGTASGDWRNTRTGAGPN